MMGQGGGSVVPEPETLPDMSCWCANRVVPVPVFCSGNMASGDELLVIPPPRLRSCGKLPPQPPSTFPHISARSLDDYERQLFGIT